MRGVHASIFALTREMTTAAQAESSQPIPALGAMQGFNLRVTEDADDTAGTVTSVISAAIDRFRIRDRKGAAIVDLTGRQLERVRNQLSPTGDDQDAPAPGDGTAVEWFAYFPFTIAAEDMPAQVDITWAPETALYSVSPTANTTITVSMNGKFTQNKLRTMRIKAFTPANSAGNNALAQLLPEGEEVEKLLVLPDDAGSNALVDADVTDVTLSIGGYSLYQGATIPNVFEPEDAEFRRSGHTAGTLNFRAPVFVVDNTVVFTLNLGTDADFDVVTVSRLPQPVK